MMPSRRVVKLRLATITLEVRSCVLPAVEAQPWLCSIFLWIQTRSNNDRVVEENVLLRLDHQVYNRKGKTQDLTRMALEMASRVIDTALQMFGGSGFMEEMLISKLYRANRLQRLYAGTSELQKVAIAKKF